MPDFTESEKQFLAPHYRRINARRLEHLLALKLPIEKRSVLELGSGIGDLTTFFLDRGCAVTSIEGRAENIAVHEREYALLKSAAQWPGALRILKGDLNNPADIAVGPHEVAFCYGLLYHLSDPEAFLRWLPSKCTRLLVLETMVTFDPDAGFKRVTEHENPSQALHRDAVRPSRRFVFDAIKNAFEFAYTPILQPAHEQFPLDWRPAAATGGNTRAIFIGSRTPLNSPLLVPELVDRQFRYEGEIAR